MAFTYTSAPDSDNVDFVRLRIGDAVENDGAKPDQTNFSDAEIEAVVTLEGNKGKAAAFFAEALAALWAANAGMVSMADYKEDYSNRAKYFADLGKMLRQQYGGSRTAATQIIPTRVDGFSNNVNAEAL